MALDITRMMTSKNYTAPNKNRNIAYLVIHWVGAVSSAKNNAKYFQSYRGASAHYFVDNNSIYQIIDVGQNVPIDETGIRWWRYLTFTNYCIPGPAFWRNLGGVWTVSFFLLFYLLVPLFQKIIRSYKMSLFITVIFLAVKVIWPSQLIEWFAPFWGLFYFMVGVTANVAIKEKKERSYITLLSIFSIFLMSIDHFDPILFVVVFCILLLSTLEWIIPSKYRAIVDLMDEYSYTIYLGHCLALQILGLSDLPKNGCLYVLIFAVVTWIICLILHNIIEKPISNVIRMKTEKANS